MDDDRKVCFPVKIVSTWLTWECLAIPRCAREIWEEGGEHGPASSTTALEPGSAVPMQYRP